MIVETLERYSTLGSELAGTAGAAAKLDFSGVSGYDASYRRKGVQVASTGAASLYLKAVQRGGTAPSPSATDAHWIVPAGTSMVIPVDRALDLYLFGTDTYTAVEIG